MCDILLPNPKFRAVSFIYTGEPFIGLLQPSQYLFEGLMAGQAMPSARAEDFGF